MRSPSQGLAQPARLHTSTALPQVHHEHLADACPRCLRAQPCAHWRLPSRQSARTGCCTAPSSLCCLEHALAAAQPPAAGAAYSRLACAQDVAASTATEARSVALCNTLCLSAHCCCAGACQRCMGHLAYALERHGQHGVGQAWTRWRLLLGCHPGAMTESAVVQLWLLCMQNEKCPLCLIDSI
jgi:hypothetical protein